MKKHALIVGAGSGISAAFARALAADGYQVALAARNTEKLEPLAKKIKAKTLLCDVTHPESVDEMFAEVDETFDTLDVVLFNASGRERGPIAELDRDRVKTALLVSSYGGFLVAQHAVRRMLDQGHGALFFTGASASVKGYAQSSSFAMGKFALRGLAQSLARELQPKNIHVAHFVIDGGVANEDRGLTNTDAEPDKWLEPDAIAQTYMAILNQPRSAWTWEVELRPWVESF
ncbi:MAG: SDR family NAD(P)-dependent oxidoreductase [Hyphomicrobiaceae bacterium]|nr:SDR family NAD(P)-dependent oxidoreductase [Hyphomicrobiaceae bacterium]